MTERMIAQTTIHGNIIPTEHKPLLADCLATPDYVLEHLNDAYAKFGEIVLVILGNEINFNDTYTDEAIIELCKKMDSAYYGVFETPHDFLAKQASYCTVEFENQTHYYCKHMAEALQEISRVGTDLYNIYGANSQKCKRGRKPSIFN